MKFLDCFCGMGGASEGFHREGFECTGIDVVDVGYPYNLILADMRELDGEDYRGYDVVWGSPPCRDFTQLPDKYQRKHGEIRWKQRKNPKHGMSLVESYLTFVDEARPKIWIMENVVGLTKYLQVKCRQISKLNKGKKRAFWGNYPNFLMPTEKKFLSNQQTPNRGKYLNGKVLASWIRAKIPLACSLAFAQACKQKLLEMEN